MRKRYDKTFKAKIAVEALRGEKTLQEIATAYEVHPNMVALWKKQLLESAESVFEKPGKDKNAEGIERKQDELFKQVGKLQVENEFLKKSTDNCTGSIRSCRSRKSPSFNQRTVSDSVYKPIGVLLQAGHERGRARTCHSASDS
jgi:transposase